MVNKILIPLDGSEHASHALDTALDLAEKYSATLLLLSVFHCVHMHFGDESDIMSFEAMQQCLEGQKAFYSKVLSEAVNKVQKLKPGLNVSTKLMEGRPADKIIEVAKEGGFDLIVMGSRGLGGIKQLVLGSVSDRVADGAPCPVLIVK
jgi:nucleotide-binding universal stress UspA family protein